ncbi:MAG: amidohydrolase family protein [Gemmatimonadota bacterium]
MRIKASVVIGLCLLAGTLPGANGPRPNRAAGNGPLHRLLSMARPAQDPVTVIQGATLLDGTASPPIPDAVIVIQGSRILCAGARPACPVPAGAISLQAAGRWVTPGFINTHVHLRWGSSDGAAERAQRLRFAFGITTTREASSWNQLPLNLAQRTRAEAATLPFPRLVVSGRISEANRRRLEAIDFGDLTRRLIGLGVDAIKLKDEAGVRGTHLTAVVEAAHAAGLPVYGHTWTETASFTLEAVRAGVDGISHLQSFAIGGQHDPVLPRPPQDATDAERRLLFKRLWLSVDDEKLNVVTDSMIRRGVWLEPLLINQEEFFERVLHPSRAWGSLGTGAARSGVAGPGGAAARGRALSASALPGQAWTDTAALLAARRRILAFVGGYFRRGGTLITGTDERFNPGVSLHEELRLLVQAGLSPLEALHAATAAAARALHRDDRIGTVEAGKVADLVVLDADPLLDIVNTRRIWRVIKGGMIYDPRDLFRRIQALQRGRAPGDVRPKRRIGVRGSAAGILLLGLLILGAARKARRRGSGSGTAS